MFEGLNPRPQFPYVIWQEYTDITPYKCDKCGREFQGGKRYLGNLRNGMHQTSAVICPDCRLGINKPEEKQKKIPRKARMWG